MELTLSELAKNKQASIIRYSNIMFKQNTKMCAFILSVVILITLSFSNTLYAKPKSSLGLSMEWKGGLSVDQASSLLVTVTSYLTTEDLHVILILPEGVTLNEGKLKNVLSAERGVPVELEFQVVVSNNATGKINAQASIGSPEQAMFNAFTSLSLHTSTATQKAQARSVNSTFRRTERNGVSLREYQLDN